MAACLLGLVLVLTCGSTASRAADQDGKAATEEAKEGTEGEEQVVRTLRAGVKGDTTRRSKLPWFHDVVVGLDAAAGLGLYLEIATMYWRRIMLVPVRLQVSLTALPLPIPTYRLGTLVGFGGFSGNRQQFSHWFVIGSELIAAYGPQLTFRYRGKTSYVGWLIPIGYDFRHLVGSRQRYSWGLRVYFAPMPLYRAWYVDEECPESSGWFSFCTPGAPRVKLPFTAGLCLFLGFR